MIADLKRYAEYKESGVPWLGQVPGHWAPTKLKHAFKRIIGGSTPASGNPKYWNGDVTWVTPADVSRSERLRRSIRQISRVGMLSCSTEMVPTGSIVLTSRAPVGNVAIADVDLCTNQGCKALIPNRAVIAPMFGFWLLSIMKAELQSLSTGTTFSEISTTRLGSAFGVLPPPAEQAAIVRFLNWANGRLERAIRAKRKVIALLNEQKQAIIHRAVTRGLPAEASAQAGLDPTVPLKPSGIPWLGDMPQHWEAKRLKAIAQIRYGLGQPPRETETGLPLIRATNVDQGRILEKNLIRVDPADVPKTRNAFLKAGEIIVVRSGALTADSAIIPKKYEGAVAGYDMVVTVRSARPAFIAMALLSSYIQADQLVIASMRAAQPHLNAEELGTAIFLLPPDEEQKQVVEFVRNESLPLDAAISRHEREIELLREYRTRLVADVVTGKLDVREAAGRLPDEALPDTAEDDTDLTDDPEAADEEAVV